MGMLGSTTTGNRPKIKYVVFDMDGLLLDTERVYTEVTSLNRKSVRSDTILAGYGKEMTWSMKSQVMGKPEREASEHLLSFFPETPLTVDSFISQKNVLQDAAWPTVSLMPGARKLIHHLKARNVPIAIATGSRRRNFELKTAHLSEVFDCFDGKIVCGDDTQHGMKSKPAPDIFLVAAREMLRIDVGHGGESLSTEQRQERAKGLVFEDGLPGVQAGKRAGMSVVWIPDPNLLESGYSADEKADQVLRSIEEFNPEEWGLPPYDS